MSRERRGDPVLDWLRAGPDTATAELVERTLAPIPRMRQRRSWRVAWDRFRGPAIGALAGAAAVAVLAVGISLVGRGPNAGANPSPTPAHPTFSMTIANGPGFGTYVTDTSTSLNTCRQAPDGSWRLLYAGGAPFVNLDLYVGAGAGEPGAEFHVAAEIYAGPGYLRFDPAQIRGGDPPGRSTAAVIVDSTDAAVTFEITATTPDRTTGDDLSPIEVRITATCPR